MKNNIFLNHIGLFFSAREKSLNTFKSRIFSNKKIYKTSKLKPIFESAFQLAPEPTPEKTKETKATKTKSEHKIFPLKLREEFLNEIKNEENNINKQIFRE